MSPLTRSNLAAWSSRGLVSVATPASALTFSMAASGLAPERISASTLTATASGTPLPRISAPSVATALSLTKASRKRS